MQHDCGMPFALQVQVALSHMMMLAANMLKVIITML